MIKTALATTVLALVPASLARAQPITAQACVWAQVTPAERESLAKGAPSPQAILKPITADRALALSKGCALPATDNVASLVAATLIGHTLTDWAAQGMVSEDGLKSDFLDGQWVTAPRILHQQLARGLASDFQLTTEATEALTTMGERLGVKHTEESAARLFDYALGRAVIEGLDGLN